MTTTCYNHEEAVLESIRIFHKNKNLMGSNQRGSMSSSSNNSCSTRRSCLKDFSNTARNSERRSIQFCDKGHRCREFQMYSDEEVEEVWFAPEDYDAMKKAFEFTVFMMDAGCPEKVSDDLEHTTRGLEKRCEEGQWKRYERKRDYYDAILDEQERQWEEDHDDFDEIARIAVEVTRDSFREAQDMGVMDEIAVYGHALRRINCRRSVSDRTTDTHTISTAGTEEDGSWPSEPEE